MSTLPGIALVTCSYQQVATLEATLLSVLDQRYPALGYAVIDGASTDGSAALIARYGERLTHWVSEPDSGQTEALIKGFAAVRGEIMGWLCSDDLLLPGALHEVGQYFAAHPEVDAVYGDAVWINATGDCLRAKREMPFSRFALLFDHNYIAQPAMFWRRRLYERVGGLDPRFDVAFDADLWERFSHHTRIAHVARWWAAMRWHPAQKSQRLQQRAAAEMRTLSRRASRGGWVNVPICRAALRGCARLTRIAAKGWAGGYGLTVPREVQHALRRYRIVEVPHAL